MPPITLFPGQQSQVLAGIFQLDFQLIGGATQGAYTIRYLIPNGHPAHIDRDYLLPRDSINYEINYRYQFVVINTGETAFQFN